MYSAAGPLSYFLYISGGEFSLFENLRLPGATGKKRATGKVDEVYRQAAEGCLI